jgi:hypothetical protein
MHDTKPVTQRLDQRTHIAIHFSARLSLRAARAP